MGEGRDRNDFLHALYEQYYDRLLLFCLRYLSQDPDPEGFAEECVQEVFQCGTHKAPIRTPLVFVDSFCGMAFFPPVL